MTGQEPQPGVDWSALAAGLDEWRAMLNALVEGLKADGFTDEQARVLVVHALTTQADPE